MKHKTEFIMQATKWAVGDRAEALDANDIWREVVIASFAGDDAANVHYVEDEPTTRKLLEDIKPIGTNTRRRKCLLLLDSTDPSKSKVRAAVALLCRANSAAGEEFLSGPQPTMSVYIPTRMKYMDVNPEKSLISWDAQRAKEDVDYATWEHSKGWLFGDELPLQLVENCLCADLRLHEEEEQVVDTPVKRHNTRGKRNTGVKLSSSSSGEESDAAPKKKKTRKAKHEEEDDTHSTSPELAAKAPRRRGQTSTASAKKKSASSAPPHAALAARYKRFEEKLQEEEESSNSEEESEDESAEAKLKYLQHRVQLFCEDDEDDYTSASNEEQTYITKQPNCIVGGQMRPYQIEGLQWLVSQCNRGIPMILADEMGLGKTLQTISLLGYLSLERDGAQDVPLRPSLVIVPLAVLDNWQREFAKWCPKLRVFPVHSADSRESMLKQRDCGIHVFLTTFEIVKIEKSRFKRLGPWNFIVLDEAHKVKNDASELAKTCREMDSQFRLLLTGTPLQNNFHELWSLLNFLIPKVFSDSRAFEFQTVSVEELKTELVRELLRSILQPFMLRRLKSDTSKEIPAKREIKLYCGMSEMQAYWYKQIITKNAETLTQLNPSSRGLQNILMQLRKVCNHPYLFDGVEPGPPFQEGPHMVENCGKMVLLDKLLTRLKANGDRVLIFSQMTQMLDILEDYLAWKQYKYCRIDGTTKLQERYELIDKFNKKQSNKFCFLLSTRAGGLGINLQTANVVILYDSDWNPFVDLQAQDRAHRIGQTKEVSVYRFITENTVEEKIVERAEHKLFLDAVVVQQHTAAAKNAALSKEAIASAVCFGADAIFRSNSSTITDEDIDTILERGKRRTESSKFTDGNKLTLGSFQAKDTTIELREQQNELKKVLQPLLQAQSEVLGKRKSRNQLAFLTTAYADEEDEDEDDVAEDGNGSEEHEDTDGDDNPAAAAAELMEKPKQPRKKRTVKPPPAAAAAADTTRLPEGWKQNVTKTGKVYYFNIHTREATYVLPTEAAAKSKTRADDALGGDTTLPPLPKGWSQAVAQPSGKVYYYHIDSSRSQWTRPKLEDDTVLPPPPLSGQDDDAKVMQARMAAYERQRQQQHNAIAQQLQQQQMVHQQQQAQMYQYQLALQQQHQQQPPPAMWYAQQQPMYTQPVAAPVAMYQPAMYPYPPPQVPLVYPAVAAAQQQQQPVDLTLSDDEEDYNNKQ